LSQGKTWRERAPEREALLDLSAPIGHDYWTLMNLAGQYAYAGREWVARKVVRLLGGREVELCQMCWWRKATPSKSCIPCVR